MSLFLARASWRSTHLGTLVVLTSPDTVDGIKGYLYLNYSGFSAFRQGLEADNMRQIRCEDLLSFASEFPRYFLQSSERKLFNHLLLASSGYLYRLGTPKYLTPEYLPINFSKEVRNSP
jgi:hypothetical protein